MPIAVVYTSPHGHTRKVANTLGFPLYDVATVQPDLTNYDVLIFLCPTYGDEELPPAMEDYLEALPESDHGFLVCELGNYYGYDDFEFGAARIIETRLKQKGWVKKGPILSLDSLPQIDWKTWNEWSTYLRTKLL